MTTRISEMGIVDDLSKLGIRVMIAAYAKEQRFFVSEQRVVLGKMDFSQYLFAYFWKNGYTLVAT